MNFDYEDGGIGKGGMATILVNGAKYATDRIERTQGTIFFAGETTDASLDKATPVTADYKDGDNSFTGKIFKVGLGQSVDVSCGKSVSGETGDVGKAS